ncbi:DNA-methyltransferase [Actinomadura sp. SCN-SB]|uniref:DNA-methyltransferase n=1 Tax=Actinomadura sp. SCN-SB TaxID=3373092 RepID=UPI003751794A
MTRIDDATPGVIRADARRLPLPDESVDLVVTSPPYFALRDYRDGDGSLAGQIGAELTPGEYVDALIGCTREWMRVLKPSGSLWVNLGDKYAGAPSGPRSTPMPHMGKGNIESFTERRKRRTSVPDKSLIGLPWRYALRCIDDLGLTLRAEIIWSKPSGMPESVQDRARRSHEQFFHFTRRPRYYAAVDEIREPLAAPNRVAGRSAFNARNANHRRTSTGEYRGPSSLGALPGSVWTVATQPLRPPEHLGTQHFAAFPPALIRRIVLGWSPPGGLVVDPFGGTGTTALVASVHGRRAISFDLSHDYGRLAQWRTTDPAERARALGAPPPPPVPDGQLELA